MIALLVAAQTYTSADDAFITAAIITGAITFIGVVFTSVFSYLAHKNAKQANEAVNHKKPGQDRLFDMVVNTREDVKEIKEWKSKWDDWPSELGSSEKVVSQFKVIEDRIVQSGDQVSRRVDRLAKDLTSGQATLSSHIQSIQETVDSNYAESVADRASIRKQLALVGNDVVSHQDANLPLEEAS